MNKLKVNIFILMLAVAVAAWGAKTPINNGVLQSDLDAAFFKILHANLSDYAGTGLSWNVVTGKLDATGGGGGGGSPGGSTTQYQYNNAGVFGGISSVTYDGTIPLTITKDGGANTRFTGIQLVNPGTPAVNTEGRQSPAIHLIESVKTSGVVHTYDHMIWGENTSIYFGTSVDGSAVGGTGHAIVGIDSAGNIYPASGDQILTMADIRALDSVATGGDVSHPSRIAMSNDSIPGPPFIGLANNGEIWWDAGGVWTSARGDTSIKRSAVGVMKLANSLELTPLTVATLPTGVLGRSAVVNDGAASLALGATVTGGGSTNYAVWYNGTNWIVTGGGVAGGAVSSVFTRTGAVVAASGDYSAFYQPLDTDLTIWAGLTPSANFQTMSGHTFSQMQTDLGLVIGTNVQAFDTDLTTWAGITPVAAVGTWIATPSSANLRSALTDENGTGAALFSGATSPDFTTGLSVGAAAASGKILMGNGTVYTTSTASFPTGAPGAGKLLAGNGSNYILTTPTYPNAAGAVGYLIRSDGTNFTSYPNQQTNSSTTNLTPSTSDIYLAGSSCVVAAGDFKAGGQYRCVFDMTKSAGTGAIVITLRIGTAGTVSDPAIQTFTFGAGTSVADTGVFDVVVNWRSVGSGTSAVVQGICRGLHNVSGGTTGLFSNGAGFLIIGSPSPSSGFASNTATTIGLSFNGSTAFAGTNTLVQAQLQQ